MPAAAESGAGAEALRAAGEGAAAGGVPDAGVGADAPGAGTGTAAAASGAGTATAGAGTGTATAGAGAGTPTAGAGAGTPTPLQLLFNAHASPQHMYYSISVTVLRVCTRDFAERHQYFCCCRGDNVGACDSSTH